MREYLLTVLLVVVGGRSTLLANDSTVSERVAAHAEKLAHLYRSELVSEPKFVNLPGGKKAFTVLLRCTIWSLKSVPQSGILESRMKSEAMKLPENERLKEMNKLEDYRQVWWVSLAEFPNADTGLKKSLPVPSEPHRNYREMAYIGRGDDLAWYGYLPIYEWINIQQHFGIYPGDDAIEAAFRGLSIEDAGSCTRNSCEGIIIRNGAKSVPRLKALLESDATPLEDKDRVLRVLGEIPGKESGGVLLDRVNSSDQHIASIARWSLIAFARPEATDQLLRWLDEDAGKKSCLELTRACWKFSPEKTKVILPRILDSPKNVWEFREAFEMSRASVGKRIPAELLDAERQITGFPYTGLSDEDNQKIEKAVKILAESTDVDAATVIAISLSTIMYKGDWQDARRAGTAILQKLPPSSRATAERVFKSCGPSVCRE